MAFFPAQDDATAELRPWRTLWTHPRQTVAAMTIHAPWRWLWLLILAGGTSRIVERIALLPSLVELEPEALTLLILVSGAMAGALMVFVIARILHWVLRRIGGVGSWTATRTAVAWALAPGVPSLALWAIMVTGYGYSALTPSLISGSDDPRALVLTVDYGVQFGLTVWSLLIEILCLSDAHRLAVWKVIAAEAGLGLAIGLLTLIGFNL